MEKQKVFMFSHQESGTRMCDRKGESAHKVSTANFGWRLLLSAETSQIPAKWHKRHYEWLFYQNILINTATVTAAGVHSISEMVRHFNGVVLTLFPENPMNSNNLKILWGRSDNIWKKQIKHSKNHDTIRLSISHSLYYIWNLRFANMLMTYA